MKFCMALLLAGSACAQTNWKLDWSDEFNGPAGASPDAKTWTFDLGNNNGWGNRELESYTSSPVNSHTDGKGNLVIRVEKTGDSFTSARLKTKGLYATGPGKIEARVKVPSGKGMWPAFWMLGDTFNGRNWPAAGEIDIMEALGREPSINHGSLHGPGYSGGKPMTAIYTLPDGKKFADDFHTFSIEWSAASVSFFVDGNKYETVTPADLPAGTQWVFDQPFFLLFNVAVGGNFAGPLDPGTVFPSEMLVDYVRVYHQQ